MDESRIASAINDISLDEIIKTYGDDAPNLVTAFSLASPLIISIFALTIFSLLIVLQYCIPREDTGSNSHYTKQKKAAIISFVTIGFVRLVLIVAFDGSATHYTQNLFEVELERIHHDNNTEHNILYSTPFILLAFDVAFLMIYLVVVIVLALLIKFKVDVKGYYHLAVTLSLPIASILLHLPYIAIAYLNDANHAGSVLILYTIVTLLEFIVLQFIFTQWYTLDSKHSHLSMKCHACLVLIMIFSLILLYGIISISVCFFYYLPINHSISSTSNQIIIIYQTGLVFVGAFIAYKAIFETRNVFVKALDGCKEDLRNLLDEQEEGGWETSTDQEKLTIFYQHIIKYAIPTLNNRVPVTELLQGARSTHEGDQQSTPDHEE